MARKPRNLRPDEWELWDKVAERAVPLHPDRPAMETAEKALIKPSKKSKPLPRFSVGEAARAPTKSNDIAPKIEEQVMAYPLAMDRKRYTRMKRGKLSPEARIDLHGLTLAQAHPALMRFIMGAVADGMRLVLVITGKGKSKPDHGPIPERHGVLRHQVPHWLHSMPLKPHILQVTEAHIKHGGQGAYYVYLRRNR